ncbi:hypothetical protein HYC85_019054 [Camellia sinensis]|uniref:Reverse transcriptase zinc-binding domain-containing protein n=1 Tax=Camellia sinensis TaxID=4442 RepID=A0A7J7GKR7_CAMSI|nr:hypothetical protein HYC85_019054 [Camellia sinensis]
MVGRRVGQCFSSFKVEHLIDFQNRALFLVQMAEHISNIHLPLEEREDQLVWKLTKDGRYAVKSGYYKVVSQKLVISPIREHNRRDVWKRLCKLNIPPKWALFIWKLLHRILPVRVILRSRSLETSVCCPRCLVE